MCKNAQNEAHLYELSDGYTYYFGNDMDWFSAKRFCDALHAEMITLETLGCSSLNHCDFEIQTCRCEDSQLRKDLHKGYLQVGKSSKSSSEFYWLNSDFNSCQSHAIRYASGTVTHRRRDYDDNDGLNEDGALCRKKN